MKVKSFPFAGLKLSYYDSESDKPPILFCHANGYSAGCYQYYFNQLKNDYRVLALDFAGHGRSEMSLQFKNWYFFRDQILTLLEHEKIEHITSVGHSLGGASTLLASVKEPDRFKKLIVWDPVILGFKLITLAKILGNPLARGAAKRRSKFSSLELVRRSYKKFPAFANFNSSIYEDYLASCFRSTGHGQEVELCCDPRVETQIFSHSHYQVILNFYRIKNETHVLIPKKYEVCSPTLAGVITKKNPYSSVTIWEEATHFFPFEKPEATLEWLMKKI
jgi:pimeloyl-ACP methyl ester carboxylesterase